MISLLKYLGGTWEQAKGFLLADLDHIESALNERWNATFGDTNKLKATTISGDSSPATRYVANTGAGNSPNWDQVNLTNGVKERLPYANFVEATTGSKIVGRRAGSAGDFEEIDIGNNLQMSGTTLNARLSAFPVPIEQDEPLSWPTFPDTSNILKQTGPEITGGGAAVLGANSPASTLTAPYTWLQLTTSDGLIVYLPVWK